MKAGEGGQGPVVGHALFGELVLAAQEYTGAAVATQVGYLLRLRALLDRCIHEGSVDVSTVSYVTLVTRITQTVLRSLRDDSDAALSETIRELVEELEGTVATG